MDIGQIPPPSVTMIPSIETERLLLRPFAESDLDAYARMCSDSEVMRYVGGTYDRADSWRSIAMMLGHWQLRGYGLWAAEEKASAKLVGRIGLYNPEGWPGLEVGWLLERSRWGAGLATEGGQSALGYAFEELGAKRVISVIERGNYRSIRVAEKLGEELERSATIKGKEVVIYGIDRPD